MKLWNLMTKDFFFNSVFGDKKKAFFSDQQQSWKQTMKDVCVCINAWWGDGDVESFCLDDYQ